MSHDMYSSPLASRYASDYMLHLFSDDSRYQTWRRLWTALARASASWGCPLPKRRSPSWRRISPTSTMM